MTTLRQLRTLVPGVVVLFLALGLSVPATAATLNFNFGLDGTELLLVDNAGVPLTRGFVALYQFGNPGDAHRPPLSSIEWRHRTPRSR